MPVTTWSRRVRARASLALRLEISGRSLAGEGTLLSGGPRDSVASFVPASRACNALIHVGWLSPCSLSEKSTKRMTLIQVVVVEVGEHEGLVAVSLFIPFLCSDEKLGCGAQRTQEMSATARVFRVGLILTQSLHPPPALTRLTLDKVRHLLDAADPRVEALLKCLQLALVQHTRLHPGDLGQLGVLVEGALDQLEAECFHDEMLYLVSGKPRLDSNRLKAQSAVCARPSEHTLDQRHETDLLPQERLVLRKDRLGLEVGHQRLKPSNVARVEGEQENRQP